jgi:chromosome partitioning protein
MKILACYSIKGGVGKTASAVNIAYHAALSGQRTLLCDLDSQGASSFYFRVRPAKKFVFKELFSKKLRLLKNIRGSDYRRLDILPANLAFRNFDIMLHEMKKSRSRLQKLLKPLESEYDLIVLDCPPNITLLSENVFEAADRILIPVIPTTLSERTLEQLYSFFDDNGLNVRKLMPFFSLVEYRKRLHGETIERVRKDYRRTLTSEIPYATEIEKMGLRRKPVGTFAPSSGGAHAYERLWKEVKRKLKLK